MKLIAQFRSRYRNQNDFMVRKLGSSEETRVTIFDDLTGRAPFATDYGIPESEAIACAKAEYIKLSGRDDSYIATIPDAETGQPTAIYSRGGLLFTK